LKLDRPRRLGRPGLWIFGQGSKDQPYFEDSPIMVEMMPITGNYMTMHGFPEGVERKRYDMGDHIGGPYPKYHRGCDKMMFFYGTDPENLKDLGAHVEYHLGEGEDEEIFEFEDARCVFIPKGVRHGPIFITRFRRTLVLFNVYTVPTAEATDTDRDWSYLCKAETMLEVIGDDAQTYREFFGDSPT